MKIKNSASNVFKKKSYNKNLLVLMFTFLKIMNEKFREISAMVFIIDAFGILILYIDFY